MRKILPRVVTSANEKFFFFLPLLAEQVKRLFKTNLVIYDIGLTKEQRKQLKRNTELIPFSIEEHHLEYDRNRFIKTTHKILIIRDFIKRNEPFMLIDADCLPIQRIYLDSDFDLGLTRRHFLEIKPKLLINGKINAGVIIVATPSKIENLLAEWEKQCLKHNVSDQKGLSDLLDPFIDWKDVERVQIYKGVRIKILPAEIYNDVRAKTGRILHFKNAGRFEGDRLEYLRFAESFQNPWGRAKKLAGILARRALMKAGLYYRKHKSRLELLDMRYD